MIVGDCHRMPVCIFMQMVLLLGCIILQWFFAAIITCPQGSRRFFKINTRQSSQTSNYVKKFSLENLSRKKLWDVAGKGQETNLMSWVIKIGGWRSYASKSRLETSINEENWWNKNWLSWVCDQGKSQKTIKIFHFCVISFPFASLHFLGFFWQSGKCMINLIYLFKQ
jgi:hypothetical protein